MAASAVSRGPAPVSCEIATAFEQVSCPREEWDTFVEAAHGGVYFTYDYCRIWWKYYGRGRDLRIFLFRVEGQLVGIVPVVVGRLSVGPLSLRLAKLLGSDSTLAVLHPPVKSEHATVVYQTVISKALHEFRCDVISFSMLSGERDAAESIRCACDALGPRIRILRDRAFAVHTVFHLPVTFDEYLASLSRSERGNYRRCERRLSECGTIVVRQHETPEQVDAAFDRFVALHERQWHQVRKLGHFGDWPESRTFTHELLRVCAALGRAQIEEMAVGQTTVGMEISLFFGDTCHRRLPARCCMQEWERRGIGRVALVRQVRDLIAQGTRRIEAGSGHYPYKLNLGGVEYCLHSLLIVRNRRWVCVKARALAWYADLLNCAYYGLWFSRLASRLPFPRRPLWKSWIRTRI